MLASASEMTEVRAFVLRRFSLLGVKGFSLFWAMKMDPSQTSNSRV